MTKVQDDVPLQAEAFFLRISSSSLCNSASISAPRDGLLPFLRAGSKGSVIVRARSSRSDWRSSTISCFARTSSLRLSLDGTRRSVAGPYELKPNYALGVMNVMSISLALGKFRFLPLNFCLLVGLRWPDTPTR